MREGFITAKRRAKVKARKAIVVPKSKAQHRRYSKVEGHTKSWNIGKCEQQLGMNQNHSVKDRNL